MRNLFILFIVIIFVTNLSSAEWVDLEPPYYGVNTWSIEGGLATYRTTGNKDSGAISSLTAAFFGASAGQALIIDTIWVDSYDPIPVKVEFTITTVGGTINYGYGSFAGTRIVYGANNQIYYRDLDYGLSFENVVDKIISIAELATNYIPIPTDLSALDRIFSAAGFISDIVSYTELANQIQTIDERVTTTLDFTFWTHHGQNIIKMGVRTDAAGVLTGAGFGVVAAQVSDVKYNRDALAGDWIPIPAQPVQWIAYDANGDGDDTDWWDYALRDNTNLNHIGIYHPYSPTPDNTSYIVRHRNGSTPPNDHLILNNGIGAIVYEDEYMELDYSESDLNALDNEGTFEAWIKPMHTELFTGHVIYAGEGGTGNGWGNEAEIHLSCYEDGRFFFWIGDGTYNISLNSSNLAVYQLNQEYYHIAGTYKNTSTSLTANLYVNGEKVDWLTMICNASIDLDGILLGKCFLDERYFRGKMKGVKIHGKMLSHEEIQRSYWNGGGDTGNPSIPEIAEEPAFSPATTNLINWQESTDDVSGIASYHVKCMDDTRAIVFQDTTESTSCIFSDLQNGIEYFYQVAAIDSAGNISGWSSTEISIQDTLYPADTPVFESEPAITGGLYNTLFWSPTTDAISDSVFYFIQCDYDTEFDTLTSNFLKESEWITDSLYTFTGLDGDETFYYRVKAADRAGNETAWSDTVLSYQDASAPTMNQEPETCSGTLNYVSWNAPVGAGGGTTYLVQCSDSEYFGARDYFSESGWISDTNYTFNDLEYETIYFYHVKAKDEFEVESPWSEFTFSRQVESSVTFYISPSGDDSYTSEQAQNSSTPWRTIQWAVSNSSEGFCIKVMDDDNAATADYTENIIVDVPNITIMNYDSNGTKPQVNTAISYGKVFKVISSYVTIKGLEIYGAYHSSTHGIYVTGTNCAIINNSISANGSGISIRPSSNNSLIKNNIISDNTWDGVYLEGNSNIVLENIISNSIEGLCVSESYNVVTNNTFIDNELGVRLGNATKNTVSGNQISSGISSNYGILVSSYSSHNNISTNTITNYEKAIYIATSNNTFTGNKCSSCEVGIFGSNANSNTFYLNSLYNNIENIDFNSSFGNSWNFPTKFSYIYDNSRQTFKNNLGNYYDDFTGDDTDGDGIGDTFVPYTIGGCNDYYPLIDTLGSYAIQTWFLADTLMWQGNMANRGTMLPLDSNSSYIWSVNEPAQEPVEYPIGDIADSTTWTGQITFSLAPTIGHNFTVQIGYADDQQGTNFWEDGPDVLITGNGVIRTFTFLTSEISFTVPQGKHLAMKLTNNNVYDYCVLAGCSWSFCSSSYELIESLAADFTANDTTVFIGDTIQFTDLSPGSPTSWEWDFENDGTIDSNEQNPQWIYNSLGTYSVSLTVTDAERRTTSKKVKAISNSENRTSSSLTKTDYINVSEELNADFTADKITVFAGFPIQFTDLSSGSPTSWEWDFNNDGIIDSNEQNPQWIYNTEGNYTVYLSIADNSGRTEFTKLINTENRATSTELKIDYITVSIMDFNEGLVAMYPFSGSADDCSGNGNDGIIHGATLTADRFGNTDSAYNFYGNYISFYENPIFPNEMTVSCWISKDQYFYDNQGIISRDAAWSLQSDQNPEFGISFNSNSEESNDVFTQIPNSDWYHICAVHDGENNKIYRDGILIDSSLSETIDNSGGDLYIGQISTSGYFWYGNIDDIFMYNRALSELEVQHLYSLQLQAAFTANDTLALLGNSIQFTDLSILSDYPILTWEWDFDNDGTIDSNEQNPSWTYDELGTYAVSLTITDIESRAISTQILTDYITVSNDVNDFLKAYYPFNGNANDESGNGHHGTNNGGTFVADRFGNVNCALNMDDYAHDNVALPYEVRFQPQTSASLSCWINTSYQWSTFYLFSQAYDFRIHLNEHYPGSHENNSITFLYPNNSETSLSALGDFNNNGWVHLVFIKDTNLNKMIIYQNTVRIGERDITDVSFNDSSYLFIGHTYDGLVDDVSIYGCVLSEMDVRNLYTSELDADFTVNETEVMVGVPVQFTDYSLAGEYPISTWEWDFNNDGTIDSYEQNPQWTYNSNGIYSVSLTVTDAETRATSTETKTDYISAGLVANFTVNDSIAFISYPVHFTDQSSSPASPILTWEWDFDNDGTIDSNEQNPSWIYGSTGTYTVSLTITNADTRTTFTETKNDYITVYNVVDYGLVAQYPFNGNTNDESGNGYNGTPNGGSYSIDRFGNTNGAFSMDGDDWIILPDEVRFQPLTSTSLSCWIKTSQTNRFDLFHQAGSSLQYFNFGVTMNDLIQGQSGTNGIDFIYPYGSNTTVHATGDFVNYEWVHLAFVKDVETGKMKIFQNNVLIGELNITDSDFTVQGELVVGSYYMLGYNTYHGLIDDIRIYDLALSDFGIQRLYSEELLANFNVDNTSPFAGNPVQFTDLSSYADYPISTWEWDFNNDSIIDSNDQNPLWSYDTEGTYSVSLTVTDTETRATHTTTKSDYIEVFDIPDNGIIAYYPFNEDYDDKSSNNYHGSNYGATFANDRFGNTDSAVSMNAYDRIMLPDQVRFQPLTSASLSCWIKTAQTYTFGLFGQNTGSANPSGYNFGIIMNASGTNEIDFYYPNYNTDTMLNTTSNFTNNEWVHYVFIKDIELNKMSIYQNNVKIAEMVISDINYSINGLLTIGRCYQNGSFNDYNGLIDDVCIYNLALSDEEIEMLFHQDGWMNLESPQNPILSISGVDAILGWDPVVNADYYLIYTSEDPYGEFEYLDSTSNETYTHTGILSQENKLFYEITGFQGTRKELNGLTNDSQRKIAKEKTK